MDADHCMTVMLNGHQTDIINQSFTRTCYLGSTATEPLSMTVSSYLLTPPRSLEQVLADLSHDCSSNSSLDQDDSVSDADHGGESTSAQAP